MMKILLTAFLSAAFLIAKAQMPTITFPDIIKTYGDAPFYATVTSNSPGAFSYSIQNDSVASISPDGQIVIKRGGSTTITANQAASGSFTASSKSAALTVNKTFAYLTITSTNTIATGDSLNLTATSNPPGANVKWSLVPQTSTNAAIVGSKLYAGSSTGSLNIAAEVVADENFIINTTSPTVGQTISVVSPSGTPSIDLNDINVIYGVTPFNIGASSLSSGLFTYSIANDTIATISTTGVITIKKSGSTTLTINQAAQAPYSEASKTVNLIVNKIIVTGVSITSTNSVLKNDSLLLTGNTIPSGAKINWSILSQSGTNSTIQGNKLYTGSNTGSLNIQAEVVADDNYTMNTVSSTLADIKSQQTISVYDSLTPNLIFVDRSFDFAENIATQIFASSNSNGTIIYSLDSGTVASVYNPYANYCEIIKHSVGKIKIRATQAAYPPFSSTSKTAIFTFYKSYGTYISSITSSDQVLLNDSLNLTATGYFSNRPLVWSIDSQNGTEASVIGSKLYAGSKRGTLVLSTNFLPDSNFNSINPVKITVTIDTTLQPKLSLNNLYATYGTSPFKINTTSNSSGKLTYRIDTDTSVSIKGDTISIKKPGETRLYIYQEASYPFAAAYDSVILYISKIVIQGITITSTNTINLNDSLLLTGVTTPVGAQIKWSINSQNGTNATIKGTKLYAGDSVGTLDIMAEVVTDDYFTGEIATGTFSTIHQTIYVNSTSGTPTIYFPDFNMGCAGEINIPTRASATSNSTGDLTYSILSGHATIDTQFNLIRDPSIYDTIIVQVSQVASPPYMTGFKTARFYNDCVLGIEESNIITSKPTAYPSPAKDLLQIKNARRSNCEASILLYNMNGEAQNINIIGSNSDDYQLDISELPSGIYSLKMTYCNEVFTQRIVKQ